VLSVNLHTKEDHARNLQCNPQLRPASGQHEGYQNFVVDGLRGSHLVVRRQQRPGDEDPSAACRVPVLPVSTEGYTCQK
jgi:hypothetical protein